jgi:dynein heavy chain
LRTILGRFSSQEIMVKNHKFSESGVYYCPESAKLEDYKNYVSNLPFYDTSDIFGLHENASIVFEANEANFFVSTLLNRNPSVSESEGDSHNEKICLDMISSIRKSLPEFIDVDNVHSSFRQVN